MFLTAQKDRVDAIRVQGRYRKNEFNKLPK